MVWAYTEQVETQQGPGSWERLRQEGHLGGRTSDLRLGKEG